MKRGGLLEPFIDHVMLEHWWKKLLTYWCKHPNIFTTKEIHHLMGVSWNMTQPLPKLQLSQSFHKKNYQWNIICMSWINNNYIYQSVNTIYYKHNIHLSSWWLERWCQKNMSLFAWDMELDILSNGDKRIMNHIMCDILFSPMNTMK